MRSFSSHFSPNFLESYQKGVLSYTYKGIPCAKSPIDLAIYSNLLWDYKPKSIIEIGSFKGGSALWLADTINSFDNNAHIYSFDINIPDFKDSRISFFKADIKKIANNIIHETLKTIPRPMLVIEDSSHQYSDCLLALRYFSEVLGSGEILIMEDGILEELGVGEEFKGGPNRAINEFFKSNPTTFKLLEKYCDMFGKNATYNPNAYLIKQ